MKKSIEEVAEQVADKTREAAGEAIDKAEQVIGRMHEKAGEIAEAVHEKAEKVAVTVHDQMEEALEKAGPALDRIEKKTTEIKDKAVEAMDKLSEKFQKTARPKVIDLRGVSIYHTDGRVGRTRRGREDELVLSDVDFSVAPGEMVYFIGRVGSGKSTLLKTLYAEVPLYEGEGSVVDFNLRKLRRSDVPRLRRKIGVVFQDYQLLADRNVEQNLRYVMKATGWNDERMMKKRIDEVLGLAGLVNKEYKMPFELSGGEQQRLAIARALINHPQVILADEPTGNLDPQAAQGIMSLFRQIVHTGCAIVMSTHNLGNIQLYPARTIRFSHGHIEEIDIHSILGITE